MTPIEMASEELIIGRSPTILALRERIRKIAPSPLNVVVLGPSGAGKELVARAVHAESGRCGPFVPCNVPSFSEGLFEDAMFGHVRGGFTGATGTTPGIFQEADRGTVFLDEVAQLRPSGQVALLRVLETRRVRPVGAPRDRPVDFRVVAATNEHLSLLVRDGTFREDLWHRLSGTVLHVPPLRNRVDDIPVLVDHFVRLLSARHRQTVFSRGAMSRLMAYPWPGNIRELKSVVESLAYLSDTGVIQDHDVRSVLDERQSFGVAKQDRSRRAELLRMLEQHRNDVGAVAAHYGRTRATIYRWLQQHGINTPVRTRGRTSPSQEHARGRAILHDPNAETPAP